MAQEDYDKGRAVGQKVQTYAPLVALIMLLIIFTGEYIIDYAFCSINELDLLFLGMLGISGSHAIKSTKLKEIDTVNAIGNLILLIGTIILVFVVLYPSKPFMPF